MARGGKVKRVSVVNKLRIIQKLEQGSKVEDLAKQFNVHPGAIKNIWSSKKRTVLFATPTLGTGREVKRKRDSNNLETAFLEWCQRHRKKLTDYVLMEKLKEIGKELHAEYLCTVSWLHHFKARNKISCVKSPSKKLPTVEVENGNDDKMKIVKDVENVNTSFHLVDNVNVDSHNDFNGIDNFNNSFHSVDNIDHSFHPVDNIALQSHEVTASEEENLARNTSELQIVNVTGRHNVAVPSLDEALEAARTLRRFYKLTDTSSGHLNHLFDIEEDLENQFWARKKIKYNFCTNIAQASATNFMPSSL